VKHVASSGEKQMSSHGASDSSMQKMMIIVGIALCVLTITIMITARTLSSGSNDEFDPILNKAKLERIQPAGLVRTEAPVAPEEAAAEEVAALSGEEIANGGCAACHASGAGGAPKFDDKAEWDTRSSAGLDALVASVVNGKGAMPPRGGSTHTDEEITRAVEYMTGLGNGGVVEAAAADSPTAATTEAAPAEEAETAEETAPAEETAAADVATDAASAAAGDEAANAVAPAETGAVAVAAAGAGSGVLAALTGRIQTTVDEGVCAGCHASGVAGAPKFDDAAEWAARAEKGFAALAQTVSTGKGAMPPRGGSDLTDDELLVAVEYMVQKSK